MTGLGRDTALPPGICGMHGYHGCVTCPSCSTSAIPPCEVEWPALDDPVPVSQGGSVGESAACHRQVLGSTMRGPRFVVVIDRDGISVSFTHGRRLAFWRGSARRRFGLLEVFTPREDWLSHA